MSQVKNPSHYNMGGEKAADGTAKYEAIKVIEAWDLGFSMGNALKYIIRAPHKASERLDLEKACWYLDRVYSAGGSGCMARIHEFDMAPHYVVHGLGLRGDLLEAVMCIYFNHSIKAAEAVRRRLAVLEALPDV
jgi:hypothetical protein